MPEGASLKSILHYLQLMNSPRFSKYDYGPKENYQKYKSGLPPLYNLTNIDVPVALLYGSNDMLATPKVRLEINYFFL